MVIGHPKLKPTININNGKLNKPQNNEETLANFITFYNSKPRHEYNYNIEENHSKLNESNEIGNNQANNAEDNYKTSNKKILNPLIGVDKIRQNSTERACETRQGTLKSQHQVISSQDMEEEIPRGVHCDKLFIIKANNLIATSYNMYKDQHPGQLPQIVSKKEIYKPYEQEKKDPRLLLSRGKIISKS